MPWRRVAMYGACALVCFGVGAFVGHRKGGADYRGAAAEAQKMASLSVNLGRVLEKERVVRLELEEESKRLEQELRSAAGRALEFEIRFAELAIEYRELEAGLAEIGVELSGTAGNISGVADDIGELVSGAEEATGSQAP